MSRVRLLKMVVRKMSSEELFEVTYRVWLPWRGCPLQVLVKVKKYIHDGVLLLGASTLTYEK